MSWERISFIVCQDHGGRVQTSVGPMAALAGTYPCPSPDLVAR